MNALLDAALHLQKFCQAQQWRFCFIGGIAVQQGRSSNYYPFT
jgi:hypothetical protein